MTDPARAARCGVTGSTPDTTTRCLFAELRGAYGWGNAALLQMSLQLVIAFLAMLFFDPRRTSNARQPALIEDAASYSAAKDPA